MRKTSNPWVILVGGAIMVCMAWACLCGGISGQTIRKGIHNKTVAIEMRVECMVSERASNAD